MVAVESDCFMLSVVVPVFNEEASLDELIRELVQVCDRNQITSQIILIDDGSTDNSWGRIQEQSRRDPRIEGIRFRRNFGKASALAAGIQRARFPFIVTIDADLQDAPEEIVKLLEALHTGADVVSGWKKNRRDPWTKRLPSKIFNALVNRLTGVRLHDHNCGLKAYRREVFDEVQLYGEMHRFVPVLAAARGWRVTELPVAHRTRKFGKSKYGASRFLKGFLDLFTVYFLTNYRQRPQHFLGGIGLLSFFAGSSVLVVLTVAWVYSRVSERWDPIHLHERAIFYYAIVALLIGVHLLAVGFLAELITLYGRPVSDPFSIKETTFEDADSETPANWLRAKKFTDG